MRRLIAPLLGAVLLMTTAGAVSADSTRIVDPLACYFFTGGTTTVPPDSNVVLRSGWTAASRGQILAFENAATWLVTVNGTPVDVTPYLGAPFQVDHKLWEVLWNYPAGTLALDATMTVTEDIFFNHAVYDGTGVTRAGSYFGAPLGCVITGAPDPV